MMRRRLTLAAGFVVVCGLAAAGLGGAVATEADHSYTGCYQSNGNVYLIGEGGLRSSCRNGDTEFTFNLRGPIGPQGPTGDKGAPGNDGVNVTSTQLQPANTNCPTGGVKLVSASATTFVCNGAKGDTGANGAKGDPGTNGAKGDAGTNGAKGDAGTNGANGTNGTDGISVQATQLLSGDTNCPTGGVKLVAANSTSYVCNGTQGPQGAQGQPGTAGSGAAGASPDRYAGGYVLELNGVVAGPVELVDGCTVTADVVTGKVSGVTFKRIGNTQNEPCTMHIGFNMSQPFWDWIKTNFSGTVQRLPGQIVRVDSSGAAVSGIDFLDALPAELDVPQVDLGSSSPFELTFTLKADRLDTSTSLPSTVGATQIEQFQSSLTSVSIDNVGGSGPASLDPLALAQQFTVNAVGSLGTLENEPTGLDVPNIGLHYGAGNAGALTDLRSWYTSLVIQGTVPLDERTTTVTLGGHHGINPFNSLVVLTFGHTGIFRLDPDERQSDGAYRASLYANTVSLDAHND